MWGPFVLLKRIKVSTRLHGVIASIFLIVFTTVGQSYWQNIHSEEATRAVLQDELAKMQEVSQWQLLSSMTTPQVQALNRTQDPAIARLFGPEIATHIEEIGRREKSVRRWATSEEEKKWFADLDLLSGNILSALADIAKARATGNNNEAEDLFEQRFMPATKNYDNALSRFSEIRKKKFQESMEALHAKNQSGLWLGVAVTFIVACVAIISVVVLVRYVTGALNRAMQLAETVASGNLVLHPMHEKNDEFGTLMQALEKMSLALREIVTQVRTTSESIATASGEIAEGNTHLSARTEDQAASLEETTATMSSLSLTVRQNVDNAQQAHRLAQKASEVASNGGAVVAEVITTMHQISESSQRIAEIITLIDGIAFQTNILALNAAVEAARAGEQGRGFAVVANEVRTLAQRSAAAAQDIKNLIHHSVNQVGTGTHLVDRAGHTMEEMVSAVAQVTDIVAAINQASVEQSVGIAQIGSAINQLDDMTQQNAALVEQSSAASESLKERASYLLQSVKKFQLSA
jgi:methyl-accepting chemotaxis protein